MKMGFRIGLFLILWCLFPSFYINAGEYSREAFRHWSDLDNDGQDSRQETILNHMIGGVICPYTGQLISDLRLLDIDHIVPLAYAWDHGAEPWTALRKEQFANDPENLLAVSADVNRSKGRKPPEEWLPPNIRFIPEYVAKFTTICSKYGLSCDYLKLSEIEDRFKKQSRGFKP